MPSHRSFVELIQISSRMCLQSHDALWSTPPAFHRSRVADEDASLMQASSSGRHAPGRQQTPHASLHAVSQDANLPVTSILAEVLGPKRNTAVTSKGLFAVLGASQTPDARSVHNGAASEHSRTSTQRAGASSSQALDKSLAASATLPSPQPSVHQAGDSAAAVPPESVRDGPASERPGSTTQQASASGSAAATDNSRTRYTGDSDSDDQDEPAEMTHEGHAFTTAAEPLGSRPLGPQTLAHHSAEPAANQEQSGAPSAMPREIAPLSSPGAGSPEQGQVASDWAARNQEQKHAGDRSTANQQEVDATMRLNAAYMSGNDTPKVLVELQSQLKQVRTVMCLPIHSPLRRGTMHHILIPS
jgi:hypothetical protein